MIHFIKRIIICTRLNSTSMSNENYPKCQRQNDGRIVHGAKPIEQSDKSNVSDHLKFQITLMKWTITIPKQIMNIAKTRIQITKTKSMIFSIRFQPFISTLRSWNDAPRLRIIVTRMAIWNIFSLKIDLTCI